MCVCCVRVGVCLGVCVCLSVCLTVYGESGEDRQIDRHINEYTER